jgi:hypothetical protein
VDGVPSHAYYIVQKLTVHGLSLSWPVEYPSFYQATFVTTKKNFACLPSSVRFFFFRPEPDETMWSVRPPELAAAESLKLALHESLRLQPNKLNHHPIGQFYKNSCEKYCATRTSLTKSVAES